MTQDNKLTWPIPIRASDYLTPQDCEDPKQARAYSFGFNFALEEAAKALKDLSPKPFTMGAILEREMCIAAIRALKTEGK